jgi:hypothetical protein
MPASSKRDNPPLLEETTQAASAAGLPTRPAERAASRAARTAKSSDRSPSLSPFNGAWAVTQSAVRSTSGPLPVRRAFQELSTFIPNGQTIPKPDTTQPPFTAIPEFSNQD